MKNLIRLSIYSLLIALLVSGGAVFAQSLGVEDILDAITITQSPKSPTPGDSVSIHIESYATDLNTALISWYRDGTLESEGTGRKDFSLIAGRGGEQTEVSISIKTSDGNFISKQISITPSSVDLVWQADVYTPPFYPGKALYSHQSDVRVIALPHLAASNGIELGSSKLLYTWTKDGNVEGSKSGYGRNSFSFTGSVISRPVAIAVKVSSLDGETTAVGQTTISPRSPEIVFYLEKPLLGVDFNNALSKNFGLSNIEDTFIAIPFFFSTPRRNYALAYEWFIDGIRSGQLDTTSVTLQKPAEDVAGRSTLSVSIENPSRLLQFARKSLLVSSRPDNQEISQ